MIFSIKDKSECRETHKQETETEGGYSKGEAEYQCMPSTCRLQTVIGRKCVCV